MFKKNLRKISITINMANFIWNLHKKLLQPEKSRKLRCWDFFGQIVFESFWKLLKAFWKPLETGYFPLECPSEVIIAYAISKRSKFEFFQKKTFFCENVFERLQEHYLAFFVEIACQTFILLRNSQNNRIFGLFGEIDVFF